MSMQEDDFTTIFTIAVGAITSLLAMMSIAFSPMILISTFFATHPKISFLGMSLGGSRSPVQAPFRQTEEKECRDSNSIVNDDNRAPAHKMTSVAPELFLAEPVESKEQERSISPIPTAISSPTTIVTPPNSHEPEQIVVALAPTSVPPAAGLVFQERTPASKVVPLPKSRLAKRKITCDESSIDPSSRKVSEPMVEKSRPKKQTKTSSEPPSNERRTENRVLHRLETSRIRRNQQREKTNKRQQKWMTMFEKFVAFRESHGGSMMVPWSNDDAELQQLGYWVRDQQRKLRTNKLSKRRSELLQSAGLAVGTRRSKKYL